MGGLFGGKNSFFRKPLGKNSDASRAVGAVLSPARSYVDAAESISQGKFDRAKNQILGGTFTALNPIGMVARGSSSARKLFKSTGFTDQIVQIDDYNKKLQSGKNLNWDDMRGYAGGMLENAAYVGAAYAGASYFSQSGTTAGSTGTFGSKTSYLGADTSFLGASEASSSSYLGANTSFAGTTAAESSSGLGYLGAETSFTSKAAGSSFLGDLGKGVLDFGKDLGKTILTASILNPGQQPVAVGGDESYLPYDMGFPTTGDAGFYSGGPQEPIDPKKVLLVVGVVAVGLIVFRKQLSF